MKSVILSINGPVITASNNADFSILEMVYVGKDKLLGEVISVDKKRAVIQVYESTTGLMPNEVVTSSKKQVSIKLAPGLLGDIFDGVLRPLKVMKEENGIYLKKGIGTESFNQEIKREYKILLKKGDVVKPGDIIAEVLETSIIRHKIMIPNDVYGEVIEVKKNGNYNITEELVKIKHNDLVISLNSIQEWPIKRTRPTSKRLPISIPLITGQRVIDTLFPIAKGGTAAVPGGFGTGKTMMQHQIAKWCDADIIVYVGCGERGNEMTQVLDEFSCLIDPKTKKSLMERTVLIANTSNMPVAAREASIYTGLTIAEYYRDMGYHVAMMADSTSRWAEALREISGRLEEMPAEEGFPAYLPSRISEFYERAGYFKNLNNTDGSVSIIGAVSPQGADFSEPVTQNTKRFVRCFWALDKSLAYQRHYAAINWNISYSEYIKDLSNWYDKNVGKSFLLYRQQIQNILNEENSLMEIVKLIGSDILPDDQKLVIEIGRVIRQGFLQQNAFHKEDTYVSLEKQLKMMKVILHLYDKTRKRISDVSLRLLLETGIFDEVIKIKYEVKNDEIDKIDTYYKKIDDSLESIK